MLQFLYSNKPFCFFCSYHFKAKPFDRRVVEYEGLFGVKRCKVKQLTETEPFSFESDERSEARKNDEAEQDQVGREFAEFLEFSK